VLLPELVAFSCSTSTLSEPNTLAGNGLQCWIQLSLSRLASAETGPMMAASSRACARRACTVGQYAPCGLARGCNVEFFPSAAAAEVAGYRPCLRCRPETAPFSPAWRGSRTTVDRTIRLIHKGAVDEGSVENLATAWSRRPSSEPTVSEARRSASN